MDPVFLLSGDAENYDSKYPGAKDRHVTMVFGARQSPEKHCSASDEPTGNLDSVTSQDVLSLLKVTSSRFGQTVVMITHNEEIAQMADRIVRIEDGRIRGKGGEADA